MTTRVIPAIDDGTTNSKAVLFAQSGAILATGSSPVQITHPQPVWVQQPPKRSGRPRWQRFPAALSRDRTWRLRPSASRTSAVRS